jgi:hypothetical protein
MNGIGVLTMDKYKQDKHGVIGGLSNNGVHSVQRKRNKANSTVYSFVILAITFLVGSVFGTFTGMLTDTTAIVATNTLNEVVGGFYGIGIFPLLLFPALAVFLGLSIPGTLLLPLLTAARGYTLSFSIAVVLPALSADASSELLRSIALPTLVSVTALMAISTQALLTTTRLLRMALRNARSGSDKLFPNVYRLTLVICAFTLMVVALMIR